MSLRTTQQIDKLIVGQILPRDSNNSFISTGQILVTDNQGRANWTTLSTVTGYIQFTSLSSQKGSIQANSINTALNIYEGGGMNFQFVSNALYVNTNAFQGIDISGGNSLLSSNSSNNVINPRLKFATGNYAKIRGDPGTNTIFIDFDYLSTMNGARATYNSINVYNNSTNTIPPISERLVLNAIVSDATLTLIGIDDLQITTPFLSPSCNILFIGLSTITTAKFSTVYYQATTGMSNLSTMVDILNNRQINTQGLQAGLFYPISTLVTTFSTTFSQFFLSNWFTPVSNQFINLSSFINTSFSNNLNTKNINASGTITASHFYGDGSHLTGITTEGLLGFLDFYPISTIAIETSTITDIYFSTLSSYIHNIPLVVPPVLSTNSLSTGLLTASNISASIISTNYGFFSTISSGSIYGKFIGNGSLITNLTYAVPPNLSTTQLSTSYGFFSTISAGTIYGKHVGDGSGITNITGFADVSNMVNFLLTVTNISDLTMSTSYGFFSSLSAGTIYGKYVGDGSQLTNVPFSVPPFLSTTRLSTGILTASNISSAIISTNYGFFSTISAGLITAIFQGDGSALRNVPFTVPSFISANVLSTGTLTASNISSFSISTVNAYISNLAIGTITPDNGRLSIFGLISTGQITTSNISAITASTNYGFFSTISAGSVYGKFIGDGFGLTNLSLGIPLLPPFLSATTISTGLLTATNISSISMSTGYGFFSTISAGTIYGKYVGDGTLMTNVPFYYFSPPNLSTTFLSTGVLTASSISSMSFATNFGQFSSISSGQVNGKFVGDGSGLVNLPGTIATNQIVTVPANGSIQTLQVPSGVTSVLVILNGAGGGASAAGSAGGAGGLVSGVITTTPGETLTFIVGKAGTTGTNSATVAGGYGGGGSTVSTQGGTGGGRTAVQKMVASVLTEVLTAGGGGGGGGTNEVGGNGGGPPSTFPGMVGGTGIVGNGKGGTSSAGGLGGTTNMGSSLAGGNTISGSGTYSGAGGGGYYGGGGGTNNPNNGGAGGGGGGYAAASIQNILGASGGGSASSTDGSITIYYNTVSVGADTVEANTGYFSSVIANTFIGKYLGDGSALTGIVPTNISVNTISSAYGYFSTISAGIIYGKYIGDGSGLTNISGFTTVSNNLTTVSNSVATNLGYLTTVSNTGLTVSNSVATNLGYLTTVSNTGLTVSNSVATNLGYLTTVSNTGLTVSNSVATNLGYLTTVSNTGLTTSNNLITVSNSVATNLGYLTTVSNTGLTTSNNLITVSNSVVTNFGYLTSVSNARITDTTNITTVSNSVVTNLGYLTTVSNTGLTTSNNLTTVSNSVATNLGYLTTVSNTGLTVSNSVATNLGYLTTVSNTGLTVSNSVATNLGYLTTVSNTGLTTSNNLITVSNSVATNLGYLTTVSNTALTTSNNLITVSNSVVTNFGYLTSVSNARITDTTNITTVSNSVATNLGYLTTVSNTGLTTSNNLITVSNSVATNLGYLTTVSNTGLTTSNNLITVSNSVATNLGYLTTVSNARISNTTNITTVSNSVVTNLGYLTTVSNNLITVSNSINTGRFLSMSTNTISTSLIVAGYLSSPRGYISSLTVDSIAFGLSNSYISMGDIITTSVSTIQTFTSSLITNNLQIGTVSSLSYIVFPGLQQGYAQTVIAEQSTGTGTQELMIFKGSTATDRIRIQTTGTIVFEPGVSARVFPSAPSNATPAMIINASSNVGIGVAAPTVSLDVAGAGRFTAVSTNAISTASIIANAITTSNLFANGLINISSSVSLPMINGSYTPWISSYGISTMYSATGSGGATPVQVGSVIIPFPYPGNYIFRSKAIFTKATGASTANPYASLFLNLDTSVPLLSTGVGFLSLPYTTTTSISTYTSLQTTLTVTKPLTRKIYYYDQGAQTYTSGLVLGGMTVEYCPPNSFDPSLLSAPLASWFDGTVGLTTSSWFNRAFGTNAVLSGVTIQTQNGLNCASFTDANSYGSFVGRFTGNGSFTIFAVHKMASSGNSLNSVFVSQSNVGGFYLAVQAITNSSGYARFESVQLGNQYNTYTTFTSLPISDMAVIGISYDNTLSNANSYTTYNGSNLPISYNNNGAFILTETFYMNGGAGLPATTALPANVGMTLCELLFYDGAVGPFDASNVVNYLRQKWRTP